MLNRVKPGLGDLTIFVEGETIRFLQFGYSLRFDLVYKMIDKVLVV